VGRVTSSPPQFGHVWSTAAAHAGQNVHSNEQMTAGPSGAKTASHRSHIPRISSMGWMSR
jgi:hypothetical protein